MYTDRFGQPLNVGDRVVIAVKRTSRGSGNGGGMIETYILGMVPLVPHRDLGQPVSKYNYRMTPRKGHTIYMRADQERHRMPTPFHRPLGGAQDKLYVLQYEGVHHYGPKRGELNGEKRSYDNVHDVIKVPV